MARRSEALVTHASVGKARPPPAPAAPSPPAVLPVPGIHLIPAAPSGVVPGLLLEQAVAAPARTAATRTNAFGPTERRVKPLDLSIGGLYYGRHAGMRRVDEGLSLIHISEPHETPE